MEITWFESLQDGLSRALELNRPVFVDIWAQGCVGCQRMEAMSYPHPALADLLEAQFVNVRLNTKDQAGDVRRFPIVWTPHLVVMTNRGDIVRELSGFLPPDLLRRELVVAQGLAELRSGRPARAKQLFGSVAIDFPQAVVNAEALYWEGVAEFRITGNKARLFEIWNRVVSQYPTSVWAAKTTLLPEHAVPPAA